jgi:hypothetical protein
MVKWPDDDENVIVERARLRFGVRRPRRRFEISFEPLGKRRKEFVPRNGTKVAQQPSERARASPISNFKFGVQRTKLPNKPIFKFTNDCNSMTNENAPFPKSKNKPIFAVLRVWDASPFAANQTGSLLKPNETSEGY